jgi:hypothetical protein
VPRDAGVVDAVIWATPCWTVIIPVYADAIWIRGTLFGGDVGVSEKAAQGGSTVKSDLGWRGLLGVTGGGDRRSFCVCDGKGVTGGVTANEIG